MLLRFRSFSRKHSLLSEGALERSLWSNFRDKRSLVSTSLPNDFHPFSIPFSIQEKNTRSSLLIQINLLRRNNNAFISGIYNPLHLISRRPNNRVLSRLTGSGISNLRPTHQARKPFYTTQCRQKNLASQENYASESHQAMMPRLSKVGRTFCDRMVSYGRVHFFNFQKIILLCMKN